MCGKICLILTTIDDEQKARNIARSLIDEHLAACVQLLPAVHSFYRWKGKMEEADEIQIQIKTAPERASEAIAWLELQHPYEIPEIVRLDGLTSIDYSNWTNESITSSGRNS